MSTEATRCLGWAYEPCGEPGLGMLYFRYADGGWSASPVCARHFRVISSTLKSLVDVPLELELHAFDSIGPAWTRVRPACPP